MKGLIFVYGMTYGGAAISLLQPFLGFLIYVAFANLKPEALWFWSVPPGNYSRIIAIAFLFGWLLNGAGSWRLGKAAVTVYALLFYWAWMLLGACISPAQQESWYTFDILSKVFLPALAGITLINSLDRLKQLAWVLVLTQGFLALQFNQRYYSWGINANDWNFAGLDNNGIAITSVTALGLAIFLGLHADNWLQRIIAFASAGLLAHVVLFSMSRGGMLAMVVTGVVAFLLIPKQPYHYFALVIGVLVVLRLAGAEVRQEFFSSFADKENRDASAESRFTLTRDALDVLSKHPLLGCGMENWRNVAPEYGWTRGKRVHNTWAEIGATLGLPGLLSILLFYGSCCYNLLPLTRERTAVEDPWIRGLARAVLAGTAGFFVSAAAVTVDRIELSYYVIILGAGVLKVHSLRLVAARSTDLAPSGVAYPTIAVASRGQS
ncbi:O-antigen ligase family protein [Anatilimnocola sp. NA78]|uniref:O-antigen ligase family protein n=1 Tax=Anatilimnocola sp. NA78 TaxID=3415683 RepID=UPI003CE4BD8E